MAHISLQEKPQHTHRSVGGPNRERDIEREREREREREEKEKCIYTGFPWPVFLKISGAI
jgi:hypothetical protein